MQFKISFKDAGHGGTKEQISVVDPGGVQGAGAPQVCHPVKLT